MKAFSGDGLMEGMATCGHSDIMAARRHALGNLAHNLLHAASMRWIGFTAQEQAQSKLSHFLLASRT
jgi:hypothetical protein